MAVNKNIVIDISFFSDFVDRININSEKRNIDIFGNIEIIYIRYVIFFISFYLNY